MEVEENYQPEAENSTQTTPSNNNNNNNNKVVLEIPSLQQLSSKLDKEKNGAGNLKDTGKPEEISKTSELHPVELNQTNGKVTEGDNDDDDMDEAQSDVYLQEGDFDMIQELGSVASMRSPALRSVQQQHGQQRKGSIHDADLNKVKHLPTSKEDKDKWLDGSLLALLYYELKVANLDDTAKMLLEETNLESVQLKGGDPPRLKELVDLWNAKQTQELQQQLQQQQQVHHHHHQQQAPLPSATTTTTTTAPTSSSSSNGNALKYNSNIIYHAPGSKTPFKTSSSPIAQSYRPPSPKRPKKLKRDEEGGKKKHNKISRGPWLQEEEERLFSAIEHYSIDDLPNLARYVGTRSAKGVTKHLTNKTRLWGKEMDAPIINVLRLEEPSIELLMEVKPDDKQEKDLISWLEWFIMLNYKRLSSSSSSSSGNPAPNNGSHHKNEEEEGEAEEEEEEGDEEEKEDEKVITNDTKPAPPPPITTVDSKISGDGNKNHKTVPDEDNAAIMMAEMNKGNMDNDQIPLIKGGSHQDTDDMLLNMEWLETDVSNQGPKEDDGSKQEPNKSGNKHHEENHNLTKETSEKIVTKG